MAKPRISTKDLCRNAERIRTGVAEIRTFLAVETKNRGFDDFDRPLILFERHWFHKFTKGRFDASHPNISSRSPGGYGTSASQYDRFSIAFSLDPNAAMKSASWGLGQVMGFNYAVAGFASVGEFVDAMKESEGRQLDAAISFIAHNGLDDELRRHDWRGFARGYNGNGYEKNDYHNKLAYYYKHFSAAPQPDCKGLLSAADVEELTQRIAPQVSATVPANSLSGDESASRPAVETPQPGLAIAGGDPPVEQPPVNQIAEQIINTGDTAPPPPPVEDKTISAPAKDGATASATKTTILGLAVPPAFIIIVETIKGFIKDGVVDAREIASTILRLIVDNQKYVLMLVGLFIALLIVKKILKQVTFWISMITHAVPGWNNVTVVPIAADVPAKKWWQIWK